MSELEWEHYIPEILHFRYFQYLWQGDLQYILFIIEYSFHFLNLPLFCELSESANVLE